ncbi:MAG: hypothetical protein M3Z21_00140 [Pseudomonadota bacterium]|nr:hypothetical protein [Pseudomonadota bacterium]
MTAAGLLIVGIDPGIMGAVAILDCGLADAILIGLLRAGSAAALSVWTGLPGNGPFDDSRDF